MQKLIPILLMTLLAGLCAGCRGTMILYGLGDDDDSAVAPDYDFSVYLGSELRNIDWTKEAEQQGRVDCAAEFRAEGPETTDVDASLCSGCDFLWRVTIEPAAGAADCLDGTGFGAGAKVRQIGIELSSKTTFVFWRNSAVDEALAPRGIGAIDPAGDFSWSGVTDYRTPVPQRGFEFYLAGEGSF